MEDKRSAGLVGHEKEVVHDNLELLQKTLGYSNSQMAELLGVELKYYECIKKNGGPLDYERLNRLYHNANVDLNRLLTNDENNVVQPSLDKIQEIARILETPVAYLVDGVEAIISDEDRDLLAALHRNHILTSLSLAGSFLKLRFLVLHIRAQVL